MMHNSLSLFLCGVLVLGTGCGRDLEDEAYKQALVEVEKRRMIDSLSVFQEQESQARQVRLAIETMELNVETLDVDFLILEMNNIQPYAFQLALRCHFDGKSRTFFIDVPAQRQVNTQSLRSFEPNDKCEFMHQGEVIRSFTFPFRNPLLEN
jgi:hypothetical protein